MLSRRYSNNAVLRLEQADELVLHAAITEAVERGSLEKPGFFVSFDSAAGCFGDHLIFSVDPVHLRFQLPFVVNLHGRKFRLLDYFLGSGHWPELALPIASRHHFKEIRYLAEQGGIAAGSDVRRRFLRRAARGNPVVRNNVVLATPELIALYFAGMAELVDSIRNKGVIRRPKLNAYRLGSLKTSPVRSLASEVVERDVGVAVGANGEIYRSGSGLHRTAAAICLGLRQMPVELRLIHVDFLRRWMGAGSGDPMAALRACVDFLRQRYGPQPKVD